MDNMPGMPGMGASSSTSTTTGNSTSQQPNTVAVTLSDFKVEAAQTTFKTGITYHFVIHNTSSTVNHELMAIKPLGGDGMSMSDMDKVALFMVSSTQLAPGATTTVDYTFTQPYSAGQIEFACHVGSHYSLGMHMPLIVTQG